MIIAEHEIELHGAQKALWFAADRVGANVTREDLSAALKKPLPTTPSGEKALELKITGTVMIPISAELEQQLRQKFG